MNRERLITLFDEIGSLQQAISEHALPLSEARDRIHARVLEVVWLLPPGNQHIWSDFLQWIMQEWAQAERSGGHDASEPWRLFLVEMSELVGPLPN